MKKNKILFPIISIIVLSVLGYYFRWHVNAFYYNLTHNHFKMGDKMYASDELFKDKNSTAVFLYRIVRPLTEKDIDKLSIDDYEKILKKKTLNPTAKPYVINVNKYFAESDLIGVKSAYIGLYQGREVLDIKIGDQIVFSNFYKIEPYKKVFSDTNYDGELPKNYTWTNNQLYILALDISDEDVLKSKK
ncbi:hypothetical protein ACFQ3S_02790 [Mucilaginibacter terrae]|uniref:hypothetical protein n=1 Tax=Mucilaginibacter terrae TaxID=1955052 RepID=UPI00362E16D9